MELFGASIVKLSLLAGVFILSIVVYFVWKSRERTKVIKELNDELKEAVESGNRDSVDIVLRRLREKR